MEHRISRLEGACEQVADRLGDMLTELRRLNDRIDEMRAETARQLKEQNDRLDRHHAENTQRIDAQNRLIVAVTGLALTAAGVVIGLLAAGVIQPPT